MHTQERAKLGASSLVNARPATTLYKSAVDRSVQLLHWKPAGHAARTAQWEAGSGRTPVQHRNSPAAPVPKAGVPRRPASCAAARHVGACAEEAS